MTQPFYVTTPIYYVNDVPHIGHAYSTVATDLLVRYGKVRGRNVYFLTGTDEHGQKVQEAAAKRGVTPQEHVPTSERFREQWASCWDLTNDHFIRTTDPTTSRVRAASVLQQLWDKGEIYKSSYKGLYNVRDERFYSESDIREGRGPAAGEQVEEVEGGQLLLPHIGVPAAAAGPHRTESSWIVQPDFRRNEVLGFLRQPLGDLCISRPKSRLSWGIDHSRSTRTSSPTCGSTRCSTTSPGVRRPRPKRAGDSTGGRPACT